MTAKLVRAAAAAVAAFGIAYAAPAAAQQKVTLLTWAGPFLEAFESVRADVERATGTKVEFVTQANGAAGLTMLEAQRANPQVDLWTAPDGVASAALTSGVIEPMSSYQVENAKHIPPKLLYPSGPTIWMSARGIFYRKDKVPFEITKWEDLWDPRLKGLVTVSIQQDKGAFMILASLLAGGSEKNMDPGFEKLKQLKPNIGAVYKADMESLKFIESGEVAVSGWGILGVIYKHLGPGSNYKFVMPEKPQLLSTNVITLVKGRPNKEASVKVMNAFLEANTLTKIVDVFGSIPGNSKAKAASKIRDVIPPIGDHVYQPDLKVVDANYSAWVDRWNREIQTR